MKEQNGSEKKKRLTKEKRFYLFSAIGCAAALVAVIIVAVAITAGDKKVTEVKNPPSSQERPKEEASSKDENEDIGNESVGNTEDGMIMPISNVAVGNDYGFYHNQTLNYYYEHQGVDFTAEVGTEVQAVASGVVESIYRDDVLTGTEITIDHGNGLKSVYRFVEAAEGLTVGAKVAQGDVIATVAEATGKEYKDGAHLHFEIFADGKNVDPATYLTFEEK